jgi:hypothetical protein
MKQRKILVAAMICGGALVLGAGVHWHLNYGPVAFDAAIWLRGKQTDSSSKAPRLRMADGLVRSGILLGKTQGEIESMLGPPAETGYFRDFDLVYWLGPERSFIRIDSEWLVIRLDDAGRACEVRIVRD